MAEVGLSTDIAFFVGLALVVIFLVAMIFQISKDNRDEKRAWSNLNDKATKKSATKTTWRMFCVLIGKLITNR